MCRGNSDPRLYTEISCKISSNGMKMMGPEVIQIPDEHLPYRSYIWSVYGIILVYVEFLIKCHLSLLNSSKNIEKQIKPVSSWE